MKKLLLLFLISVPVISKSQDLKLNEREYFERQGINVLVFSNNFNGGFNDEKNSGIEIIHHGVYVSILFKSSSHVINTLSLYSSIVVPRPNKFSFLCMIRLLMQLPMCGCPYT